MYRHTSTATVTTRCGPAPSGTPYAHTWLMQSACDNTSHVMTTAANSSNSGALHFAAAVPTKQHCGGEQGLKTSSKVDGTGHHASPTGVAVGSHPYTMKAVALPADCCCCAAGSNKAPLLLCCLIQLAYPLEGVIATVGFCDKPAGSQPMRRHKSWLMSVAVAD
jgi:hypothetical protein